MEFPTIKTPRLELKQLNESHSHDILQLFADELLV